ncbi:type II toxin-antitoxin system Phd/YefM family antitoxin [Spiribacter roseus]|uniref:type II toxin-antitoxin system Phd/YefM family antitoxin n=1 Tax=Spiribacter roseus TaxID=1855875 RepID=UPI00133058E6|nr:type II toxin-antitoxin system Phd/YefM family antitoxin [Spiribacter roseus]KAF0282323.1 prevent-host-death protein [Spiribacter roseus]
MSDLTDSKLETQGVFAIEAALKNETEAVVSVRGERRYVVMDMTRYTHLRECELAVALAESRADLDAGRFVRESVDDHLQRISEAE